MGVGGTPWRSVLLEAYTQQNWREEDRKKKNEGKSERARERKEKKREGEEKKRQEANFDKSLVSQPFCSRDLMAEKEADVSLVAAWQQ